LPQQAPSRNNPIQDYVTVAERVEKFYDRYPEGRIITHIVEHDAERGFILMRAEVYRSPDDAHPSATGHAYEYRDAGYVQKNSYIETGETSAVGRALAFLNFETKRGIATREEIEKATRASQKDSSSSTAQRETPNTTLQKKAIEAPEPPAVSEQKATDEQKQSILGLLEDLRPGDRRAQRELLLQYTKKDSRDELLEQEARSLIYKLKREVSRNSI
jgi:hypothetical protein